MRLEHNDCTRMLVLGLAKSDILYTYAADIEYNHMTHNLMTAANGAIFKCSNDLRAIVPETIEFTDA